MAVLKFRKATEADPLRGRVPAEHYDIVSENEVFGTIQLRLGNTDYIRFYGCHVGYSVEPQYRDHGRAGAAIKKLNSIERRHSFHEIWITCRPDNLASWCTLEKSGATYERTVNEPVDSDLYARGDLQIRRYCLTIGL